MLVAAANMPGIEELAADQQSCMVAVEDYGPCLVGWLVVVVLQQRRAVPLESQQQILHRLRLHLQVLEHSSMPDPVSME